MVGEAAAGNAYVPEADQVGTITKILDSSASVANSYAYDAFGVARSASEAFLNPYRFAGKPLDVDPDLYHFIARQYDPRSGRFGSRDTAHWRTFPSYEYCSQVLTHVDVTGEYDDELHKQWSADAAKKRHMKEGYASAVGQGSWDVDHPSVFKFWFITIRRPAAYAAQSEWHKHFNMKYPAKADLRWDSTDSRYDYAEQELAAAIALADECKYEEAATALGRGLHAVQDWFAHGNWDPTARQAHPGFFDDPDVDFVEGVDNYQRPDGVPVFGRDAMTAWQGAAMRHLFRHEEGQRRATAAQERTRLYIRRFFNGIGDRAREEMFENPAPLGR